MVAFVLVPVILSLLLGPGTGQLFNREYKKGFILIGLSFAFLGFFSAWLVRAATPYIPSDITTIDQALLRNIIQNHIIGEHTFTFYTYEVLLAGLWLYSVIDAYKGGMRRIASRQAAAPPSSTPSH